MADTTQDVRREELEKLHQEFCGAGDTAYIRFIEAMSRRECLGWEAKVAAGKFTQANLTAHCEAHEGLGRHRAYYEAAKLVADRIRALTKE